MSRSTWLLLGVLGMVLLWYRPLFVRVALLLLALAIPVLGVLLIGRWMLRARRRRLNRIHDLKYGRVFAGNAMRKG